MSALALLLCLTLVNGDITTVRDYEAPPIDVVLSMPFSMDYGPDGKLFVLDGRESRVLVWGKDGKFLKAFGSHGQGPGQFVNAAKITVSEKEIWVWDYRHFMSVFDLEGTYKTQYKKVGIEPRHMAPLADGRVMLGSRHLRQTGDTMMMLYMYNPADDSLGTLFKMKNEAWMTGVKEDLSKGSLEMNLKAFPPDIDLQKDDQGNWYFGFGQDASIYRLDGDGKTQEVLKFNLPEQIITDGDRELMADIDFPMPNGKRFAFKDFPGIKFDYSHAKAYYTHFLIKGDKIAFVLTPIGSLTGLNNGFSRATFYIADMKTKEVVKRGRYEFPLDSLVYYRNGRILGCIVGEEDNFQVKELALKGM